MKIGILTFHCSYNYGAVLQAHALCQTLRKLGHLVSIIDYVPPARRLHWWQQRGFRAGSHLLSRSLRRSRFERFRERYFPLTRRCRTTEDLRAVAADLDAVIVGSDQVWNGHIVKTASPSYFLDFVSPQCRRISYAASFGDADQPPQTRAEAGFLLHRFQSLSVRDDMSANLVRELSGRNAEIVLDPTLLHDFRDLLGEGSGKRGYIAAYVVSREHMKVGGWVMREVSKRSCLPVIAIWADTNAVSNDCDGLSAGPLEWLRLLQGATFICTDSFHGIAVALKFEKPFVAWSAVRPRRVRTLLNICDIQNRLVDVPDLDTLDQLIKMPVDYGVVSEVLSRQRDRSYDFLNMALAP